MGSFSKIIQLNKRALPFLAASVVLIGIIYGHTFTWLQGVFSAPDSYYSHGYLVLPISLFLIWQKRGKLIRTEISTSKIGFLLLIAALLLQIASSITEIYLLSMCSFLMLLAGLIIFLFGNGFFKEIIFPYSFLIFMVPVPMFLINYISFPMRQVVTASVVFTLKSLGLPIMQKGFEIIFPHSTLLVDTPCSGLRSLITFLALSVLLAYFLSGPAKKKLILIAAAFPIAMLSNYLRVLLLSFITFAYGAHIATESFLHNFSGLLVFAVGFGVLMILRGFLNE